MLNSPLYVPLDEPVLASVGLSVPQTLCHQKCAERDHIGLTGMFQIPIQPESMPIRRQYIRLPPQPFS